jgi:hypothetical protein
MNLGVVCLTIYVIVGLLIGVAHGWFLLRTRLLNQKVSNLSVYPLGIYAIVNVSIRQNTIDSRNFARRRAVQQRNIAQYWERILYFLGYIFTFAYLFGLLLFWTLGKRFIKV